ncbi:hypothetical protein [Herbaspirillum huttiense]|uniref:hypothetical protein n=1 Tax=Herbaspirillum huttiense TaxID=863372 RepID=UPI000688FBCC|nr:hypothetical protein [Herbaspirillum huttiense]
MSESAKIECRILLKITGVRVHRLQQISDEDARTKGINRDAARTARSVIGMREISSPVAKFSVLWQSINGASNWDANPWLCIVEFRRISP